MLGHFKSEATKDVSIVELDVLTLKKHLQYEDGTSSAAARDRFNIERYNNLKYENS